MWKNDEEEFRSLLRFEIKLAKRHVFQRAYHLKRARIIAGMLMREIGKKK